MSTNDTVLLLACGASGVTPTPEEFDGRVHAVCADLARQLLADAEGATQDIAISRDAAHRGRRGRGRPGRSRAATCSSAPSSARTQLGPGARRGRHHRRRLRARRLDVAINGVWVCRDGAAGEDRAKVDLSGRRVTITVDLKRRHAEATVWTNDLTAAYVHENSAYST